MCFCHMIPPMQVSPILIRLENPIKSYQFEVHIMYGNLYTTKYQPNNEGLYIPRLTLTRDSGRDRWLQGQAIRRAREAGVEPSQPFDVNPFEFQPSDHATLANTSRFGSCYSLFLKSPPLQFPAKMKAGIRMTPNSNIQCSGEIEWKTGDLKFGQYTLKFEV